MRIAAFCWREKKICLYQMLVILPACGLENGRKLVVRADQQVERGKVLAFCGPYFMNFLVLHVFADVSVELNFIDKNVV